MIQIFNRRLVFYFRLLFGLVISIRRHFSWFILWAYDSCFHDLLYVYAPAHLKRALFGCWGHKTRFTKRSLIFINFPIIFMLDRAELILSRRWILRELNIINMQRLHLEISLLILIFGVDWTVHIWAKVVWILQFWFNHTKKSKSWILSLIF